MTRAKANAHTPEGQLLWQPSADTLRNANLRYYMEWLSRHHRLSFHDYEALWQWSTDPNQTEAFWQSIWQFFEVIAERPSTPMRVLGKREMPGAEWFPGTRLNYAEHIFRNATESYPALQALSETRGLDQIQTISWRELQTQVCGIAAALRVMGVQAGDCVASYLPNIPEAVIAFLACASIGAVWSSCSPDLGAKSVIDRFQQIQPKVLLVVDGYRYNGKEFDRREVTTELVDRLVTLESVIHVPYLLSRDEQAQPRAVTNYMWPDLLKQPGELIFERVPFEHPLWVLYSSGTTGLPKPIVQSQGGILLEHLKATVLQYDLKPGDRFFWFTTTGWMMWNFLVSGLLAGAIIQLYDGSPSQEDMGVLWRFAQDTRCTLFGTSAAYIAACMKTGMKPGQRFDLSHLRGMGSTGSPLSAEGFDWVYQQVKADVWLAPISGGTDMCSAFVGACPTLPVYAGEMQCRWLGAAVQAFDDAGRPVQNNVGELVVTQPMPSMPIYFWNDAGMQRYRESYFEMYAGVWRHGDWIKITPRGGAVIYGRSDSTINRQGVRMGTSEVYRIVEAIPEILDSLIIDLEMLGRVSYMPLFVVLREGCHLDEGLRERIRQAIRSGLSARQLPDAIFAIAEVPRTLNGKKLEVPVKRILLGHAVEQAVNLGSVANPAALEYFVRFRNEVMRN